ncbi:MAG: flagellar basal-body rod protein FlgC [Eubacteriales bacterium]|nr:flagellar basal-body rod protein FlgC [Eubacteriales bacterium]MDN5363873.1 flagellar basal-body rod protein FlgC [Eubacteriales bacterium]
MGLFTTIDISASGLSAQRLRMDIIADNIANVNTTRSRLLPDGTYEPYRRKVAIFEAKTPSFAGVLREQLSSLQDGGVRVKAIVEDPEPFKLVYNPEHPDADGQGYVRMPNVNLVTEMVDMISATRAYEANVTVLNASKAMFMKALEIGRG